MSELEDLAAEVRALAQDGNRAQQLTAAMASEIDRLGGDLASLGHLRHLGGLSEALDALSSARSSAAQAAAQLRSLQAGADAFADRLVGGGDSARSASALGAVALAATSQIQNAAERLDPSDVAGEPIGKPALSTRTLQDIRDHLAEFNPKYPSPFEPANEYQSNCGNVAANLFDYLNGADPVEAGTGTLSDPQMDSRTGMTTTVVDSPDEIIQVLKDAGPGSHAVVGILRNNSDGHWFNVFYDGKDVYTIDAQPLGGRIIEFPPSIETDVYSWDVSLG